MGGLIKSRGLKRLWEASAAAELPTFTPMNTILLQILIANWHQTSNFNSKEADCNFF